MSADRWFENRAGRNFKLMGICAWITLGGCTSQPIIEPSGKGEGARINSDPRLTPTLTPPPQPSLASPAPTIKHTLQFTQLTIHVGKAGKLARLGHNHLIQAPFSGTAWIDPQGTLHATASVRVEDLVVDDPQHRAAQVAAGNADYASVPSAKNIRDTRANMLSAKVLDTIQFPQISAVATATAAAAEFKSSTAGSLNAVFSLNLRGASRTQPAKLDWQRTNDGIAWTTAFTVSHQQLGMTPFSALGGALRVADDLRIELQGVIADPFSLGSE